MSSSVLDASAVLAFILDEPVQVDPAAIIGEGAAISTVNLSEVLARLLTLGFAPDDAEAATDSLLLDVTAFTEAQARAAARLRRDTDALGLPLGDRACLALGRALGRPVYTADRSWAELRIGCDIRLIR